MRLPQAILLITAVYILAFVSHAWHLQRTVYGDGVFYYSWLRSVVVDHDINFTNDYTKMRVSQPNTPLSLPGNKYSIGPALLWAPAFINTHLLFRGNGWELPYQLAVGFVSVFSAICGLILITRLIKAPQAVVALTLLSVAGATNLLFYGAIDPVNSHALSFFAAAVFLSLLTNPKKNWTAIGGSIALISMIRFQDIVYVIALLPFIKQIEWKKFLLGSFIGFLPQLIAWQALYGTMVNPYLRGGESFNVFRPHILGVLFDPSCGLFLWTPIVAVGLAGLIFPHNKSEMSHASLLRRYTYLGVFGAQLYVVSSWSIWWQGASISGRMFVGVLPIIAIGLSYLLGRLYVRSLLRAILPLMVLGLCMINAMGIFYYLFTY